VLRGLTDRGIYRVSRQEGDATETQQAQHTFAMNGPADESNLESIERDAIEGEVTTADVRWVDSDQPISLEGKTFIGHDFWKYLMLGAILCLLVEMFLLTPQMIARFTGAAEPTQESSTQRSAAA